MKPLFSLLLTGLFLYSCSEDKVLTDAPSGGEAIPTRIQLLATEMTPAIDNASTRGAGISSGSLEVVLGNEGTRAAEDKTEAEKKIFNAWLLQFGGTTESAKLVAAPQKLTLDDKGYSDCQISGDASANRVYVIANVDAAEVANLTTATTLGAFETHAAFPQSVMTADDVAAKGLPMAAYKDFIPSNVLPGTYELKSRMAKLSFQYTIKESLTLSNMTATLRSIPNKMVCKTGVAGVDKQPLTGATYESTYELTKAPNTTVTVYIPENLAGINSSVATEFARSVDNSTAYATYVEIGWIGAEADNKIPFKSYYIYLGDIATNKGDFNVVGNTIYDVLVNIQGENGVVDKRVECGNYENLSLTADGTPATANCYLTTPNKYYYFDATKMGNDKSFTPPTTMEGSTSASTPVPYYVGTAITPSTVSPVSADALWETYNTTEKPVAGKVVRNVALFNNSKVLLASRKAGNAVIAVRGADGSIAWSWHIWNTSESPKQVELATIAGGQVIAPTLMDRNLGALNATVGDVLSCGLLYQWGRKDPFPGGVDFAQAKLPMATSVELPAIVAGGDAITPAEAVKNPATFYKGSNWTSRNDNLWGTPLTGIVKISVNGTDKDFNQNPGLKTIYDPCPIGWKMAPAYTFANMKTPTAEEQTAFATNKGHSFAIGTAGTAVWFPASGYRYGSGGTWFYVGADGGCWVGAPNAANPTYGGYLGFSNSGVNPAGNSSTRANGYSVRCVLEK